MPPMMIQRTHPVFAGLAALLFFTACASAQVLDPTAPDAVVAYGGPEPVTIETQGGPVTFMVELAETAEARQRGLMHRGNLDAGAGMLFDFEEPRVVSIWMQNTLIPLDILFIRPDGTIAKIVTGAVPGSRRQNWSDVPVLSVLEINSGQAEETGIAPGDLVLHRWFATAPAAAAPETPVPAEAMSGDESGAADEQAPEPADEGAG